MTEAKNQSSRSLADQQISLHLRPGADITPEILKDIAKLIKYVEEMEHIRKTYCPRCCDRATRELNAQYGVEEFDDL